MIWLRSGQFTADDRRMGEASARGVAGGSSVDMLLAMSDTASFVQFPHPGAEHRPRGDRMSWSSGNHGRKFLLVPGRYVADDEQRRMGEVVFWGEWEAPSRIERRWQVEGDLPRVLHTPYWTRPRGSQPRQNTDPWVFGDRMLYSNCKQVSGTPRRPTGMQSLSSGSVVCFGSTRRDQFWVDTVFVVAAAEPWVPDQTAGLDLDEAFLVCVAQPLSTWAETNTGCASPRIGCAAGSGLEFTLYRGATLEEPVHGMYSFVPARPVDHPTPRFARPVVRVPERINPASRQSPRGARRLLPIETVRQAWTSLRDQVLTYDFVLATSLVTPPCAPTPDTADTR